MINIEKNIEHEREEKSVEIEEEILNRVYNFMYRQKVHLFPHANAGLIAPCGLRVRIASISSL